MLGDPWSPGSECVLGVCGKLLSCSLDPKPVTHLCLILFLALCPFTGHLVPGVSQNPCYYITEMGWDVTLRCDPMPGPLYHSGTDRKGMEFLMSIYNKEVSEKAHFLEDRFSAEMPNSV